MNKKTRIITLILLLCILLFLGLFIYYRGIEQDKKKILDTLNIQFKDDISIVEYGDTTFKSESVMETKNGDIMKYPTINVMSIGKQMMNFTIQKDDVKKIITHEVQVKDSKKPVIQLYKQEVTIKQGSTYVLTDNIKEVKDPIDGALTMTKNKQVMDGEYLISSDLNSSVVGTYICNIQAMDKNHNSSKKTFSIKVINTAITNNSPLESNETIQPTYINGILIVNKNYPLPKNYGKQDTTAYMALQSLQDNALKNGYSIPLLSGYRSYNYQKELYHNYVARDGKANADRYSAKPGYSEHQSGLCFDVGDIDNDYGITKQGKWLARHCGEYGFVIRYPQGKEDITGYMYEPWHIRYVGKSIAQQMMAEKITLEEYLGIK